MSQNAARQQDSAELRREIISACRHLLEIGHFVGTWGNVSVRVEEGFLVTPSAVDYAILQPEDFVVVSMDGNKISGERIPSTETELHRRLLIQRPDIGAFVHTHALYASCMAASHKPLPVVMEDMAQMIGGQVKCTRYAPGGRNRDLSEVACQAIGENATAVLLGNHGAVVGGRTLAEAVTASKVLEKSAFIYIAAEAIGGCIAIPNELVGEERNRLLHHYGKEDVTQ